MRWQALRRAPAAARAAVHRLPGGAALWRVLIASVGAIVVIIGIILLPLPGPGWLIIFVGLGIWATEFAWAERLLARARRFVSRWTSWVVRQPRWGQMLIGGIGLGVIALVGGVGWIWYGSG